MNYIVLLKIYFVALYINSICSAESYNYSQKDTIINIIQLRTRNFHTYALQIGNPRKFFKWNIQTNLFHEIDNPNSSLYIKSFDVNNDGTVFACVYNLSPESYGLYQIWKFVFSTSNWTLEYNQGCTYIVLNEEVPPKMIIKEYITNNLKMLTGNTWVSAYNANFNEISKAMAFSGDTVYGVGDIKHYLIRSVGNSNVIECNPSYYTSLTCDIDTDCNFSSPKPGKLFMAVSSRLYYYEHSVNDCLLKPTTPDPINYNTVIFTAYQIAASNYDLPWLITNPSKKVYQMECPSAVYYFNEVSLLCVVVCPTSLITNTTKKRCETCEKFKTPTTLMFQQECRANSISCSQTFDAVENDFLNTYACKCTGSKPYAFLITTPYIPAPISRPDKTKCVSSCTDLNLVTSYGKSISDILSEPRCMTCTEYDGTKPFFDEVSKACVNVCPSNSSVDTSNKLCLNCKNYGSSLLYGKCKKGECSLYNATSKTNTTTNECVCGSNYFYPIGLTQYSLKPAPAVETCISDCNEYNLTYKTDTFGGRTCITCEENSPSTPYFDQVNKKCVSQLNCPKITITNDVKKICVINCNGKKLKNGVCVDSCGSGSIYDLNNVCISCKDLEFDFLNECITKCPPFTAVIGHSCINCKLQTPEYFLYKGKCIGYIPTNAQVFNSEYNYYIDCVNFTPAKFIQNKTCVDFCSSGYLVYEGGVECFNFKELNKFSLNNFLVDSCPITYYNDSNNICLKCSGKISDLHYLQCINSDSNKGTITYFYNYFSCDYQSDF